MGMEIPSAVEDDGEEVMEYPTAEERQERTEEMRDLRMLKTRPGILLVGPPAVGKRSLVSRLVTRARTVQSSSDTGATCQGWTIDTKYYSVNVCLWTAGLDNPGLADTASIQSEFGRCEALVMVFDLSNPKSFEQLQEWVTTVDLAEFEILLCVGNKADRVPEHFGHAEYRRKLQKRGESSSDPHPEFWDFGIDKSEGSGLLDDGEVESVEDRRRSCIQWCSARGIEYIEACTINEVFDECMSVDGDLQGVARIFGALSAHMWPGLVMKSQGETHDTTPSQCEQDITSDDDSDYYIEYELLSNGSAEPWESSGWEEQWSFSAPVERPALEADGTILDPADDTPLNGELVDGQINYSSSTVLEATEVSSNVEAQVPHLDARVGELPLNQNVIVEGRDDAQNGHSPPQAPPADTVTQREPKDQDLESMEQLMNEMVSMRMNMRSMSDQHRREMASQLAMRMASMFNDEDEESD